MKVFYIFFIFILFSFTYSSSFKSKVVLVTGGSEGIGFSTSLELARRGAYVVFCARDSNSKWFNGSASQDIINSDKLVQEIGGQALFFKADIRIISDMRNFVSFAHTKFGHIDHFVQNAGIGGWIRNLTEIQDEHLFSEHDPIVNNLYGTIIALREIVRYWKAKGDPSQMYSIVALTSENGVRSCPGCSLYSASKYGIVGVVKSLALELVDSTPKIRVNAVAPGLVDTSLTRNQVKSGMEPWEGDYVDVNNPIWIEKKDTWINMLSGKRIAQPDELARSIISILDNDQSYLNGAVVSVDNTATDV